MVTDTAMRNLEWLGDRYYQEHLSGYELNELLSNPLSALWFVLASAFQRGRGFDLSNRYFTHAHRVLLSRLTACSADDSHRLSELAVELNAPSIAAHLKRLSVQCNCLESPPEHSSDLLYALCPHLKKHSPAFLNGSPSALPLNNSKDLEMVGGLIELASRIGNILGRLDQLLSSGGLSAAYRYLTGEGKVRYIGEKIAALFIQDLCLLRGYQVPLGGDRKQLRALFPVDTLVTKVAEAFHASTATNDAIKDFFIGHCTTHHPAKIAAGIWYMARQPLPLFINLCLSSCDFQEAGRRD